MMLCIRYLVLLVLIINIGVSSNNSRCLCLAQDPYGDYGTPYRPLTPGNRKTTTQAATTTNTNTNTNTNHPTFYKSPPRPAN
uniref:Secreted protein n=1 Tax=Cannabis sativa TaxID=3483 RepID=A0A803R7F6_CANSA